MSATEEQRAACRSMGTAQCAAICMSHFAAIPGECQEAARVWTKKALARERARRPNGPLALIPQRPASKDVKL